MRKFFFLLLVLSGIFPAYSIDTHWNLEPVVIKNGVSDNTIYNVCYGSDGFIWLSTDKGISRYYGFRFRDYPLIMGIDSLSTPLHQAVKKLCEGPDGLYYALLFQGGITCFDKDIEKFLPVRFDKPLELGVTDVITFPGFQGPEEVRAAMEKSEIYLVTSDRKEGWGAVVNEAMNSGCAVVADHMIGAAPWLIRQGENGRMYRDGEEQELFRTVERLLRDPGECRRLGENAQQTIVGEWNARTAAERLIELCRKMKFLPEMSEEQEMPDAGQDVMQDITTPAPVIPQLWNDGPCSPAPVIPERSMYRRINSEQ
jgi:ligand-binding sensor domain-containing protein